MRTKKRHQNSIQVLFFLLLSVLVLTYSCKKMDYIDVAKVNITERFFELPKNADPILKRIVEDLKQKNSLHPFVEQFVKNEGLPVWKYAKITIKRNHTDNVINTEGTDTLVSVPIVPDGDAYVKDVLKVKINTEVLYKLFMGEQYASNGFDKDPNRTAPNAEDIVKQIMAFEKEMYYSSDSTVIYHIKDNRLFDNWPADTTKPQDFYMSVRPVGEICPIIEITYISGWEFCSSGKEISSNITKPKCPIYTTLIIYDACYDDEGGEGGWTTYPQGEPGGGDGTTTTPDSTTNPPNTLPGECGEDRNWVVYVIDTNTGEWKNPCTQEEPPIILPDNDVPNNDSTYLNTIALIISAKADSIFNWAFLPNNGLREQGAIIVKKNDSIYLKNFSTGSQSHTSINDILSAGEEIIGYLHTHPVDNDFKLRSFFSDNDILKFHKYASNIQKFTAILECGNKRFALVVEDIQKYNEFMTMSRLVQIRQERIEELTLQQQNIWTNGQQASVDAAIIFFGASSNCGLGIYEALMPGKTSFIKIN